MAFLLGYRRASLCLIGLVVLISVHFSSGQLFRNLRNNRIRTRQSPYAYQKPCLKIYPNTCDDDTTTSTTEYYPPPEPIFPIYPTTSPQVNLLTIAESCAANFITQDYEDNWEGKKDVGFDGIPPNQWPIRLTSKLFVYLMAFNMYEANGLDITERQLENSACFVTTTVNGWSITNTTGFGGKSVLLRLVQTNLPKVYRFTLPYGPLGASTGTASIILSDNNGYNVFEFCFDNGLRTFAMFARKMGENDIDAVKIHLKAIGFKQRHFIDLNPDINCDGLGNSVLIPRTGDLDLPSPRPISKDLIKFVNNNDLFPVAPLFWKKK